MITQHVIHGGGEGLILQKCGSTYERGRSDSLLKLKTAHADQEAIVVDVSINKDLSLKLPNGTIFKVPANNVVIATPAIGTVVTFSFETKTRTRDIPANPTVVRIRTDMTWHDVVRNFQQDERRLNGTSSGKEFSGRDQEWTPKRMRLFMEHFAHTNNMDPLQADSWFKSFKSLIRSKDARAILSKFKKGYHHAIQTIFPEIKFDSNIQLNHHRWGNIENRRRFFENYAKKNGLDPHKPESWYSLSRKKLASIKGLVRILHYHKYSLSKALSDLFPNIGLDRLKFVSRQQVWDEPENRRKFFENYAQANGFDPLIAKNWYSQLLDVLAERSKSIISYHQHSASQALIDLFPDVPLERSKFSRQNYWDDVANRKRFFEDYAVSNGFDSLQPEQWYSQPRWKIMDLKDISKVLLHHKNSIAQALVDLLPNVAFDKSSFFLDQYVWNKMENRRKFFEDYAASQDFDPLLSENWYNQDLSNILSLKNAKKVVRHHQSIPLALIEVFPDIEFDVSKFASKGSFEKIEERRNLLLEYARTHAFDPLNPDQWYTQPRERLTTKARRILPYHSHNITTALLDLFPNIGLDRTKFPPRKVGHWEKVENRRRFFEEYAIANGFDPLNASNWYSQSKDKIMATKGSTRILLFHKGSLAQALCHLFPNIGMEKSRLFVSKKYV